jgi:hypothetical protein
MEPEEQNPYVLISGKGRSGSNRLLDMFDASRRTVCRSEVNKIPGSAFNGIGGELFPEDFGSAQLDALRGAIRGAGIKRSARDRLSQTDKVYLTAAGRAVFPSMAKTRFRKFLSAVGVIGDASEWTLPGALLSDEGMTRARIILKLNACPTWATALVQADEQCRILHNIRDPFDYLQSWYNRFIRDRKGLSSFEENFSDVPRLLKHFGRENPNRLRQPIEENLIEVELWRWRYINERLLSLEAYPDSYMRVTYSDIEEDLLGAARRIFAFADLPLGPEEEARIGAIRNVLFQKPHTTHLDAELCERLIGEVLEDSPLKASR